MTFKHKVSLLVSLLLTVGVIGYAQQTAPTPPTPPADVTNPSSFSFFLDGGSFLGVHAEDIDKDKIGRYGLREARGVGVTDVVSGSPAEKAGLKKGDVILRFDNENVTSVRKLNRLVSEVAPDHTVRLTISRGGTEQEIAVTLAKRSNRFTTFEGGLLKGKLGQVWNLPEGDKDGFVFAFGKNRRIGVSTMQLTKQLADYFGVADGKGVLVTSVVEGSPAATAGIKAGDIITGVDGEKVSGAGDLTRALNKKKEGDVTLTLIRDRNQRTITVTPKEGAPIGQIGDVVIPDIEIPMPDINIRMPRVVIPDINVNLPKKVRVLRSTSRQPI